MIKIEDLGYGKNGSLFSDLNIVVENGEIYCLVCKQEQCLETLFEILKGFRNIYKGKIFIDSNDVTESKKREISLIDHIKNINNFETDVYLSSFIDFMCGKDKKCKNKVLEILFQFNLFEKDLDIKIKNSNPVDFKAVYLAISLMNDENNIVINDFIKNEDKEFELKFNILLEEMKQDKKAILYLTENIFYACNIADRVSFIKNGSLMPAEPIISEHLKEMDMMTLYRKYLS